MKIIKDSVPDIEVIVDNHPLFKIETMRYLDEQEDKVSLKCAEHVELFKRGFTCDLICHYTTVNKIREDKEEHSDTIKDLVLVYVNKYWGIDGFPEFEYVFFK